MLKKMSRTSLRALRGARMAKGALLQTRPSVIKLL